jgi:hypothetical protein
MRTRITESGAELDTTPATAGSKLARQAGARSQAGPLVRVPEILGCCRIQVSAQFIHVEHGSGGEDRKNLDLGNGMPLPKAARHRPRIGYELPDADIDWLVSRRCHGP